jgi:hypothetical protein
MNDNSSADKLQQLFDLYKSGAITIEEFELLKSKIQGSAKEEPVKETIKKPDPVINVPPPPPPPPVKTKPKEDTAPSKVVTLPPEIKNPAIEKRAADKLKSETDKKSAVIPSVIAVGIIVVVLLILLLSGVFNTSKNSNKIILTDKNVNEGPIPVSAVTASSILKPYKTYNYNPENVADDDLQTWWSPESSVINGPIWLKIDFGTRRKISAVDILNGSHFPDYPKYGNLYMMNNRVTEANLEFSDGTSQIIILAEIDQIQRTRITPVETSYIRLIPKRWTEGTWKDICISTFKAIGE